MGQVVTVDVESTLSKEVLPEVPTITTSVAVGSDVFGASRSGIG